MAVLLNRKTKVKKNDNSHLTEKLAIRLNAIKDIKSPYILDCFAGDGTIWRKIKDIRPDINIMSIEKEPDKHPSALVGDNIKYLEILDLNKFHAIDLDSYGTPAKQLEILHKRRYQGVVIVTLIRLHGGQFPYSLLNSIGYTTAMIKKARYLVFRNLEEKILSILNAMDIDKIYIANIEDSATKQYFYFRFNFTKG